MSRGVEVAALDDLFHDHFGRLRSDLAEDMVSFIEVDDV